MLPPPGTRSLTAALGGERSGATVTVDGEVSGPDARRAPSTPTRSQVSLRAKFDTRGVLGLPGRWAILAQTRRSSRHLVDDLRRSAACCAAKECVEPQSGDPSAAGGCAAGCGSPG